MKLLESLIPVFAKMAGIVNGNYFLDGPNGRMEASMNEGNGGIDFTAHSTSERYPPKVQKTRKMEGIVCRFQAFSEFTFRMMHLEYMRLPAVISLPVPDLHRIGAAEQPVQIDSGRTDFLAGQGFPAAIIDMELI